MYTNGVDIVPILNNDSLHTTTVEMTYSQHIGCHWPPSSLGARSEEHEEAVENITTRQFTREQKRVSDGRA